MTFSNILGIPLEGHLLAVLPALHLLESRAADEVMVEFDVMP